MSKLKKLPDDCTFPQLAEVIDPERFGAHLQQHLGDTGVDGGIEVRRLKIQKVYYKPGRSCRVLFETDLRRADGDTVRQHYYAKILPDGKADKVYQRALQAEITAPALGPGVALLRELSMVVWAYPNDPNVPGLALLANHDAVLRLLRRDPQRFGLPADANILTLRLGVAKYVPGQRCGYRYRVTWRNAQGKEAEHRFFGKAYQKDLSAAAYDIIQQIEATPAFQSGELRMPRSYSHDAAREVIWQQMLPGKSFSKDMGAVDLQRWASPVGNALAAFHASTLHLGPGLGLSQELEELRASSRKICKAYPEHATRCGALTERLLAAAAALPDVPVAPVHGSFKVSHWFDVGDAVAFIDFDGAGLGDPTYDVGRFVAHLAIAGLNSKTDAANIDAALQTFCAAYAARVAWGWPEMRVRWYASALLVSSQAYKCVKRMVPGRVDAILRLAEQWFPENGFPETADS
jgi:hypothetical protein